MPRAVLLFVNRNKPDAGPALEEVARLVRTHGRLIRIIDADSDEPLPSPDKIDLVVVLGGDGTLLGAARRCRPLGKPLLGVNIGKVGFMAAFEVESLREQAPDVFGDAPLPTHRIRTVSAEVFAHGAPRPRATTSALNELLITAGPPFRMITLSLTIDGHPGPVVSGDGLIVATPIGSTAYSVSAGGPIVAPGVDATVITPLAAQSLSFRPLVLASERTIEVQLDSVNAENGGGTTLVADGQVHHRLQQGDRVVIQNGPRPTELVANPRMSYWETLMQKMGWAAPPKSR